MSLRDFYNEHFADFCIYEVFVDVATAYCADSRVLMNSHESWQDAFGDLSAEDEELLCTLV